MTTAETALLETQMIAFKAGLMLKDALVKIMPHLPETASEAEKIKAAMKATKAACDLIHETLCRAEARREKKIIPIRRAR